MKLGMKLFGILAGLVLTAHGQELRSNAARSLFSDQKASRVGDAVMILIVETSSASNDAKTSAGRSDNLSLGAQLETGGGNPGTDVGFDLGVGRTFRGKGERPAGGL